MEIILLENKDEQIWERYVQESPKATFYHQSSWKNVIKKSLGHIPYYLVAKEKGLVKGILPLFLVKSFLWGKYLVSIPAANYGGVCADDETTERRLINKATEVTVRLNADYLELRDMIKGNSNLKKDLRHVTFIIPLSSEPAKVWKGLQKNVRAKIRKALKSDLTVCWDSISISDFHEIYVNNMKRLGSPPFGLKFFEAILGEFRNKAHLVSVKYRDKIIASDIIVLFKDKIMSLYAGALKEYLPLYPNNLIVWKEIEYGCQNGYKYYDFGRSQWGTGAFNFKKYWNPEIHQLYYHYYLNKIKCLPNKNTSDPKYKLYSKLWEKIPLSLTKLLGPGIVKYLH